MVTLEPLPADAPPAGFWVTTLPLSVLLQLLVVVGAAVSPACSSAAVAWSWVCPMTSGTGTWLPVPDVIGQTQDQATAALEHAGLTAAPTTTSNCNSTDNGNVVTQNPAGGASAGKGSSVTITVCAAATPVRVPNVIGQTQDQATSTL